MIGKCDLCETHNVSIGDNRNVLACTFFATISPVCETSTFYNVYLY